ncbi:MAG: alpha-hydroxy acid oxidase [Pseudomonadota bacterium]|nr:alpha-hydroxy acid oxidase [Pseudomonadota bacterium]
MWPDITRCYCIDDLRITAKRSLPKPIFDYLDGGAEDEITMRRNREVFRDYEFSPRVLRNVAQIDLSTQALGVASSMPLICAPTGMSRMFHYLGEVAVARAAHAAGIPYSLSTVSSTALEDIAQLTPGPKFFQLYVMKDRSIAHDLIERCKSAGYQGLYLTADLASLGNRERDLRNGFGRPLEIKIKTGLGALLAPLWLYHLATQPAMRLATLARYLPHDGDAVENSEFVNEQLDPSLDWDDAIAFREQWGGPFIIKGIQCVEDARKAVEIGASAIVISNHGGRQLDMAPTALTLLPQVVDAVGDQVDVLIDGGIRRGSDVIKAVALGAKACLIGRPYLFGLAAGGEAGVSRALGLLRTEMERVMQLIGCESISTLDTRYIQRIERVANG